MLTWAFHTKRQRAQPRSCSSSGERFLLFHCIHSVPASCPHLIVFYSDGVQEEERETPQPWRAPACPTLLGVSPCATSRTLHDDLERSLQQVTQQSPPEWSPCCGAGACPAHGPQPRVSLLLYFSSFLFLSLRSSSAVLLLIVKAARAPVSSWCGFESRSVAQVGSSGACEGPFPESLHMLGQVIGGPPQ